MTAASDVRLAEIRCVFCRIVAGDEPAHILRRVPPADGHSGFLTIAPLNPVTPGHVLVLPCDHVKDAVSRPHLTGWAMEVAATWAAKVGPCNIITSVGVEATQSVWHLHLHVVPRRVEDGLMLPWGSNVEHCRRHAENALRVYGG